MGMLALTLGILIVSAMAFAGALVASRDARLALDRRLALASEGRGMDALAYAVSTKSLLKVWDHRLRDFFAFGLARRWGMRMAGSMLFLVGLAGAGGSWLLARQALYLAVWMSLPIAIAGFLLLPRLLLQRQQAGAEQKFLLMFPDSIDMAIRMLRAGLPIGGAIRAIANESLPPVGDVFGSLADQIEIGIPLDDALAATGNRIGLADFRFFSVAVALQHVTGGNLAATLDILSEVMRRRRNMRLKAQATTGEVRMSAMVLGAIPFFVVGALLLLNPFYLAPLVTDPRGHVIIGAAGVGLFLGIFSMRHMMRRATRL